MSKVRAKTVVNDGWKQPKKRKPVAKLNKLLTKRDLCKKTFNQLAISIVKETYDTAAQFPCALTKILSIKTIKSTGKLKDRRNFEF